MAWRMVASFSDKAVASLYIVELDILQLLELIVPLGCHNRSFSQFEFAQLPVLFKVRWALYDLIVSLKSRLIVDKSGRSDEDLVTLNARVVEGVEELWKFTSSSPILKP